jgi:hypothetical protein
MSIHQVINKLSQILHEGIKLSGDENNVKLSGADNNVKLSGDDNSVKLTGSSIQLPVDLQSHDIGISDPIPIRVQTQSGPVNISALVKECIVFDSLEIRDTNNYQQIVQISDIPGKKNVFVHNSLDKAVTLGWGGMAKFSEQPYDFGSHIIEAGNTMIVTTEEISALDEPLSRAMIRLTCAQAPTSGSISIVVMGRSI